MQLKTRCSSLHTRLRHHNIYRLGFSPPLQWRWRNLDFAVSLHAAVRLHLIRSAEEWI
jgi:hypothetical protein